MYVRIARFEGGERDWDEFAATVGEKTTTGRPATAAASVVAQASSA